MKTRHYDIVIVGGGLMGLSIAATLLKHHDQNQMRSLNLALIDSSSSSYPLSNMTSKTIALSYGSRLIYESLDLWEDLLPCAEPIKTIHVSMHKNSASAQLIAEQYHLPALGYVIPEADIVKALLKKIKQYAGVTLYTESTVDNIQFIDRNPEIMLNKEESKSYHLKSSLVILATGGNDSLKKNMGFVSQSKSYEQTAIVANLTHQYPHMGQAFECFHPSGSIALLPCHHQYQTHSNLVWAMNTEEAKQCFSSSDSEFLLKLPRYFSKSLGCFQQIQERQSFPLTLNIAQEPIRPGVLLMGNAAHTLHPVAGQSYNLALRDATVLASILSRCPSRSLLGDINILRTYLDHQRADQMRVAFFTDQLASKPLKSNVCWSPLALNLGLSWVNHMPPIKNRIAQHCMGLIGSGP